jgi:hypothetical protein
VAKKPKDQMLELLLEIREKQDDHEIILGRLDRDLQELRHSVISLGSDRAEHSKYDEPSDRRSEEAD